MKILKKQKLVWEYTCPKCHTLLELDETDFENEIVAKTNLETLERDYIYACYVKVSCPVCGKSFRELSKEDPNLYTKLIPIDN